MYCLRYFQVVSGNIKEEGIKFARSVANRDPRQVCLRYKDVRVEGDIDKISEGSINVLLLFSC